MLRMVGICALNRAHHISNRKLVADPIVARGPACCVLMRLNRLRHNLGDRSRRGSGAVAASILDAPSVRAADELGELGQGRTAHRIRIIAIPYASHVPAFGVSPRHPLPKLSPALGVRTPKRR